MKKGQGQEQGGPDRRLGDFLRSRRHRITADAKGTSRRRTSGLRREEVANAAGISTEWYIKLEQGRGASPSLTTLNGIARALQLDDAERLHLLALAGRRPEAPACDALVPATLRAIVEGLTQPAYVTNRCWDVLAWNGAAIELLQADFGAMRDADRNILAWFLTDPGASALFGDTWEAEARRMVTLFRTTCDLYSADPALSRRADQLRVCSDRFTHWWNHHDIGAPRSGEKRLHHPIRGELKTTFSTFQSNDDPSLKLALYSDPVPA